MELKVSHDSNLQAKRYRNSKNFLHLKLQKIGKNRGTARRLECFRPIGRVVFNGMGHVIYYQKILESILLWI